MRGRRPPAGAHPAGGRGGATPTVAEAKGRPPGKPKSTVERLAFYAGLAGFAALGVIEWPIALITGVGHLLADDQDNRTLQAFGDALEAV